MDLVVVGSGFYGLTIAERAAAAGYRVLLMDRRPHIGGNAWSYFDDETGIEVHRYGSHLFHTSSQEIWTYVNRFTKFNSYSHRVFTIHKSNVFAMPVNLHSLSQLAGKYLTPEEAAQFIKDSSETHADANNFEAKALSLVGREVYDAFFRGYTAKQWQLDPTNIPGEVLTRLPIRLNFDNRYFSDTFEGLPIDGYEAWQRKMIDHPNIEVWLDCDYLETDLRRDFRGPVVFTGPIDQFFHYSKGMLSWRTLDFEFESLSVNDFQGTSVMNYADVEVEFTRIHEFKHLHPERDTYKQQSTVIAKEYSRAAVLGDEPYYPVNSPSDRQMLLEYRKLASMEESVVFGGRLGSYKYLDMHMAIASALRGWEGKVRPMLERTSEKE